MRDIYWEIVLNLWTALIYNGKLAKPETLLKMTERVTWMPFAGSKMSQGTKVVRQSWYGLHEKKPTPSAGQTTTNSGPCLTSISKQKAARYQTGNCIFRYITDYCHIYPWNTESCLCESQCILHHWSNWVWWSFDLGVHTIHIICMVSIKQLKILKLERWVWENALH